MSEGMENALRYHIEIDLSQKDSPHAQLIRLTGRNKEVLEVGPATGYVTKVLQQRGCRVSCIENDPQAAQIAAAFSKRMIVADVETVDFASTFPEQRFDVITFGDVLEHLVDPLGVLIRLKEMLNRGGYIVASVPNIGHSSIRLALLKGRFEYTEKGLLDRTHLRFFTQQSLASLFHEAGYDVRTWRRIVLDPFSTEVEVREQDYPVWLSEAARGDAEGITYQYVVRAHPIKEAANGRVFSSFPKPPGRDLVDQLWCWDKDVQKEISVRDAALAEARDRLDATNAKVAERDALLAERDRSLQEVHAQLAEINESLGYRLLQSYRTRIGRLFPKGSRRGTPYRLMGSFVRRAAEARTETVSRRKRPTKDGSRGPGNQQ
ncbi:MAG: methyltransferase domain-containing protein [Chloroflexi bacterium]|nr:MAG: methyltransferase domain-containing protein [Chloroflexota bacterium]